MKSRAASDFRQPLIYDIEIIDLFRLLPSGFSRHSVRTAMRLAAFSGRRERFQSGSGFTCEFEASGLPPRATAKAVCSRRVWASGFVGDSSARQSAWLCASSASPQSSSHSINSFRHSNFAGAKTRASSIRLRAFSREPQPVQASASSRSRSAGASVRSRGSRSAAQRR